MKTDLFTGSFSFVVIVVDDDDGEPVVVDVE
jgi:hypothetical protein